MRFLLQREVAQRLVALPGTKDYGILTVLLATSAAWRILLRHSRQGFLSGPQGDSRLIRVTFPEPPPIAVPERGLFTRLVKAAFSERRKTLLNCLEEPARAGTHQRHADRSCRPCCHRPATPGRDPLTSGVRPADQAIIDVMDVQ